MRLARSRGGVCCASGPKPNASPTPHGHCLANVARFFCQSERSPVYPVFCVMAARRRPQARGTRVWTLEPRGGRGLKRDTLTRAESVGLGGELAGGLATGQDRTRRRQQCGSESSVETDPRTAWATGEAGARVADRLLAREPTWLVESSGIRGQGTGVGVGVGTHGVNGARSWIAGTTAGCLRCEVDWNVLVSCLLSLGRDTARVELSGGASGAANPTTQPSIHHRRLTSAEPRTGVGHVTRVQRAHVWVGLAVVGLGRVRRGGTHDGRNSARRGIPAAAATCSRVSVCVGPAQMRVRREGVVE